VYIKRNNTTGILQFNIDSHQRSRGQVVKVNTHIQRLWSEWVKFYYPRFSMSVWRDGYAKKPVYCFISG